jgi:hypothetical protein
MRRLGNLLPSRSWMRVFCRWRGVPNYRRNTLIQRRLIAKAIRLCILLPHGRREKQAQEPLSTPTRFQLSPMFSLNGNRL